MKKIIKFIRNCVVFILWTILFTFIIKNILHIFWNFNIFSAHTWKTLFAFWNQGGVFKTPSDLTLLLILFLTPFLYIIGFIKTKKTNYLKLLSSLFKIFNKTPKNNFERILIKEKTSPTQMIEDVKNEIKSIKPEKNKETNNIRSDVSKKMKEEIKK